MACALVTILFRAWAQPTRICEYSELGCPVVFHMDYRRSTDEDPSLYLARIFAMNQDDSRDQDKDGLVDEVEADLAEAFSPFFLFDSDEPSSSFRPNYGEPLGLFQVTPVDCNSLDDYWLPEDAMVVEITYQHLYEYDAGRGACGVTWGDYHRGDNHFVRAWVLYSDGIFGLFCYKQGDSTAWAIGPCPVNSDGDTMAWWNCRLGIYLTPGKHHPRLFPQLDCGSSPDYYDEKWDGQYVSV
jgi:hypothetical protein